MSTTSTASTPVVRTSDDSPQVQALLTTAACVCALLAVFHQAGQSAAIRWKLDPVSSHGWLVPIVVAWLVWQRRKNMHEWVPDRVPLRSVMTGCLGVVCGVLLHLYFLPALSPGLALFPAGLGFVIAVAGLVLVLTGPRVSTRLFPPLALLFFMVPLPFSVQQPVAEFLQHVVARTSEISIWLLGQPVYREGYLLHLPDSSLEVASGCSGLGQFVVFFAIGSVCGVRSGSLRQGLVLILLALPVSLVANTLRITLSAFIHIYAGPEWSEGVLHEAEGLVTILLGTLLLFALAGLFHRRKDEAPRNSEAVTDQPVGSSRGLTLGARVGTVLSVLVPAVLLSQYIDHAAAECRRPPVALAQPLNEFPRQLGSWSGRDVPVEREYFLYGDQHLNRIYIDDRTGQSVHLWLVYTADGRDRGHHPQACMRSIGCQELLDRNTDVSLPGEGRPARRFCFRRPTGGSGQWVTYWYHVFDDGQSVRQPAVLTPLAPAASLRSGLTANIFADEVSPIDAAGSDEFATLVEHALRESTLPAITRRDQRRGGYLMTTDLTER